MSRQNTEETLSTTSFRSWSESPFFFSRWFLRHPKTYDFLFRSYPSLLNRYAPRRGGCDPRVDNKKSGGGWSVTTENKLSEVPRTSTILCRSHKCQSLTLWNKHLYGKIPLRSIQHMIILFFSIYQKKPEL